MGHVRALLSLGSFVLCAEASQLGNDRYDQRFETQLWRGGGVATLAVMHEQVELGTVKLYLDDLAGRGTIQRWWQLDVKEGIDAPSAAVHVRATVAVSPIAEAWSILWSFPRDVRVAKFDVNETYRAAMVLQKWADPLIKIQSVVLDALKWKDSKKTLVFLACCGPPAYFIHYWRSMLHAIFGAVVLYGGWKQRTLRILKERCAQIFLTLDTDHSGSLDLDERGSGASLGRKERRTERTQGRGSLERERASPRVASSDGLLPPRGGVRFGVRWMCVVLG